jgi:hypothetical protein
VSKKIVTKNPLLTKPPAEKNTQEVLGCVGASQTAVLVLWRKCMFAVLTRAAQVPIFSLKELALAPEIPC